MYVVEYFPIGKEGNGGLRCLSDMDPVSDVPHCPLLHGRVHAIQLTNLSLLLL